jgi:hypothetical protein
MTIKELIKSKVDQMNANGYTYSFLFSEKDYQNVIADESTLPAVFMDMPISFKPTVTLSGGFKRVWFCNLYFLHKSDLQDGEEERDDVFNLAAEAQREFHLILSNDPDIRNLSVDNCSQVQFTFDAVLSGVLMPFSFEWLNNDSICV